MGYGSSPLSLHLAFWLGVNSIDSAGHRRRAAFGNIILQGTSDRYVGGRDGKFISKKPDEDEMKMIFECGCPICQVDPNQLWKSWEARAVHNKFVIKNERERAEYWLSQGKDVYEKQLENMFSHSGIYPLWKYAKILVKYPSITTFL